MKSSTARGVRSAVAASGVAMLMFVAGCGGSEEASNDNGDEQSAETDANGEEEPAEDDSAAEEEPVADDSAAEEEAAEDEAAEDDGGADSAASGAVAPAEDFDPCTVIDAAAVSDAAGFDVEEGESDELMGGLNCTFIGADGNPSSVLVQWIPMETDLDTMIDSVEGTYENLSDIEEMDLEGASDARGFTAEVMSQPAAAVFAKVDGGMFQVMVMAAEGSPEVEVARALTELTLANV